MGVGHLNIGENQGGAQIFAPSPAIQQYAQLVQQRQAKQAADNKYLADTLAQAKPDGLRNDADRANYYKKYSDLKQQGIDAENEPDKFKKAMALANVKQGVLDLNTYADESKKQAAKENSYANTYMQNPTAWSDDSIDKHRKSTQLAVDDPNVIKDYTTLTRKPDLLKLNTRLEKAKDELTSGVIGKDVITGRQKVGNKMVNQIQTKYTADPQDVMHKFLNIYDIDDDFKHTLQQKYGGNIPEGATPVQAKAAVVGSYVNDLGEVSKYDKVKENPDYHQFPVRPSFDDEQYYKKYGTWPVKNEAAAQNNSPIYRQKLVEDMLTGVPGSGEVLKSKIKVDPSYNGNLTISPPFGKDKAMIGFNVPEKISHDKDGNPVNKIPAHTVTINTKDKNANVAVNELLNQLTGEKVDISALQTPGGKKHVGSQPQGKVATMQQIQLKVGTKGYEGYTAKELVDYYKSLGYQIK